MKKAEILKEMDRIIAMMDMNIYEKQEYMEKHFDVTDDELEGAYHFMNGVIKYKLESLKLKIQ